MYVLSSCPTQLFLGWFLSGLHLLTKDYLIDGCIYLELFKKQDFRVPDAINNSGLLMLRN